jgi:hypothetical protein
VDQPATTKVADIGRQDELPATVRLFRYTNGVAVGPGADVKAVYSASYRGTRPKQLIASKIPFNRSNRV